MFGAFAGTSVKLLRTFLPIKGKVLMSVTACQFVDPLNLLNTAGIEE
jgi:hypothetical protein